MVIPQWDSLRQPHNFRTLKGLSYDDVMLVPKKGVLDSRKDADISSEFIPGIKLEIPIISAPMSSVTETDMAVAMANLGAGAVIHRFTQQQEQMFNNSMRMQRFSGNIACAIGLKNVEHQIRDLESYECNIFVLDVAHAHCERVEKFLEEEWWVHKDHSHIIVGNIATAEAARFLMELQVDGIKVGIGPGAACTTREVTGFGVPQLSAIMEVRDQIEKSVAAGCKRPTLIADGGIKNSGDIVKALAAGADTVMLGRLLAGADEAPHPGEYFGMASKRVNNHNAPEGAEGQVEKTGPVADTIKQLAWGIRSGVSYGGARNLQELRENAEWIKLATGVAQESGVRF